MFYETDDTQIVDLVTGLDARYALGLELIGQQPGRAAWVIETAAILLETLGDGCALEVVIVDDQPLSKETLFKLDTISQALAPWRSDRSYAGKAQRLAQQTNTLFQAERWRQRQGPAAARWPMDPAAWQAMRLEEQPDLMAVELAADWDQVQRSGAAMQTELVELEATRTAGPIGLAREFLVLTVQDVCSHIDAELVELQVTNDPVDGIPRPDRSSDHYKYPLPADRRAIVEHYRADRAKDRVLSKDSWADQNYKITGRTLLNYEREYDETET